VDLPAEVEGGTAELKFIGFVRSATRPNDYVFKAVGKVLTPEHLADRETLITIPLYDTPNRKIEDHLGHVMNLLRAVFGVSVDALHPDQLEATCADLRAKTPRFSFYTWASYSGTGDGMKMTIHQQ
jgi:hypothetical protein